MAWQDETQPNLHFLLFKEKIIQLITFLGKSNTTVYTFLRNKNKVLPIKQQQKLCEILQILPSSKLLIGLKFTTTITSQTGKPNCDPVQQHGLEIVGSTCCVFCLEEPKTIMHLFCNCKFVQMFWCDVSDWLSVKFFHNFNFENRHKFINASLLYARFLIYRCKYCKCKPNMVQYFNLVNSIRQSEYFIAKSKHELAYSLMNSSFLLASIAHRSQIDVCKRVNLF